MAEVVAWVEAYLLVGFVLSWVGAVMYRLDMNGWKWELLAVLLWPLMLVSAAIMGDY